jgi:hypothetical protein
VKHFTVGFPFRMVARKLSGPFLASGWAVLPHSLTFWVTAPLIQFISVVAKTSLPFALIVSHICCCYYVIRDTLKHPFKNKLAINKISRHKSSVLLCYIQCTFINVCF